MKVGLSIMALTAWMGGLCAPIHAQVIQPVSPNPPGMAQPTPLPQGQQAPSPGSAMPLPRPPQPRFSSPMCQLPTANQSPDLRAYCSALGQ
jgi:hypothetical protein